MHTLIAIGVLVGIVIHFRPWKYLTKSPKGPDWAKKHRFLTGLLIVLSLIFLPEIVYLGKWAVVSMVAGVDGAVRGTPRSQWGVVSHNAPSEKPLPISRESSPIKWSKGANAKLRDKVCRDFIYENGVCFAGIIPPGSFAEATYYVTNTDKTAKWEAFLIDFTSMGAFLPAERLMDRGGRGETKSVDVLHMPSLSSPKQKYDERISNDSHRRIPDILECYIQTVGERPIEVNVTHRDPKGTFQYIVEVGVDETSFTLPHKNWKYLWVAPVHHKDYQAVWRDHWIEAGGMTNDMAHELFAIRLRANGEYATLAKARLFQPSDLTDGHLSLGLKLPSDEEAAKLEAKKGLQPAKVIVGIQL